MTTLFGTVTWFQLEVIGIDEAQFFEDLYDFCTEVADHDGKIVIVAGLDGDYLRYYFRLVSMHSNVIIDSFFVRKRYSAYSPEYFICTECDSLLQKLVYCLYWIILWILQKEVWFSP